jgi:hypothetical protein
MNSDFKHLSEVMHDYIESLPPGAKDDYRAMVDGLIDAVDAGVRLAASGAVNRNDVGWIAHQAEQCLVCALASATGLTSSPEMI